MTYNTLYSCPICGGYNTDDATHQAAAPRLSVNIAAGLDCQPLLVMCGVVAVYSTCNECGVLFQNPRLSDADIARYYQDGIYRHTLGITDERMDADELHRARTDAALIRQLCGTPDSHLDIGSSRGSLLAEVGARIQAGIEPTAGRNTNHAAMICQHIEAATGVYDLVTCIHALEHEINPVQLLRKMTARLAPGGRLIVEVPSWKSPGGPLRLAHLYHWTAESLTKTANMAGLQVATIQYTPHMFVELTP